MTSFDEVNYIETEPVPSVLDGCPACGNNVVNSCNVHSCKRAKINLLKYNTNRSIFWSKIKHFHQIAMIVFDEKSLSRPS